MVGKSDGSVCKLNIESLNLVPFDKITNPPLFIFNSPGKSGREVVTVSFNKQIYHPDEEFYVSPYSKTHYTNGETIFNNLTLKCADSIKMYGAGRYWPVKDCILSEKYNKIYFKIKTAESFCGTGVYDFKANRIKTIEACFDKRFYKYIFGEVYGFSEDAIVWCYSFSLNKFRNDSLFSIYSVDFPGKDLFFTIDSLKKMPNLFSQQTKDKYDHITDSIAKSINSRINQLTDSLYSINVDIRGVSINKIFDSMENNLDTLNTLKTKFCTNVFNFDGGYLIEEYSTLGKNLIYYKDSIYTIPKFYNSYQRNATIIEKNNEIYFYNKDQSFSEELKPGTLQIFKTRNLDSLELILTSKNYFDIYTHTMHIGDYIIQTDNNKLIVVEPLEKTSKSEIISLDSDEYFFCTSFFPNNIPSIIAENNYNPSDQTYRNSQKNIKLTNNDGALKGEVFYIKSGKDTLTIYSGVGFANTSVIFTNLGVFFYDVKKNELSKTNINIKDSTIIYTCVDKRGNIWAAGEYLYKITNPQTGEFEKVLNLSNIPISQLKADKVTDGVLLVATERGVYVVDK